MSIFDIFKRKNNPMDNNIQKLCHYFYISRKKITPFLINLVENNPMIVDLLCSESVSIELFNKINSNNYSIFDIEYANLELFKVLPFNEDVQFIIDIINQKINIDNVYQCFFCDDITNVTQKEKLLERKTPSFFDNIDIIYDNVKVFEIDYTHDGNIGIYSDNENSMFFYNGKKYVTKEIFCNVILTMKYEYFIKMYKNANFMKQIENCKIVFSNNKECYYKLLEQTKHINNCISNNEQNKIKVNHLLYIIKNSSLPIGDKEYYDYLIKNEYINKSNLPFIQEHQIQLLAIRIMEIIKINEIIEITKKFNNESDRIRKKNIDKPNYNIYVFLKENNLVDLNNVSSDNLNVILGRLDKDKIDIILRNKEIINKYTSRTKLNISFDNLITAEIKMKVIKDTIKSFSANDLTNKSKEKKNFDRHLINTTIINGILYLLKYCQLSDDLIQLYGYKLKKIYIDLECDDYCKNYQAMYLLNRLIDDIINIIGKEVVKDIIEKYNLKKEDKIKKIEKPIFTASIFIKEIEDFDNISISNLTRKLSELTLVELGVVLSSDLIVNKYNYLFDKKTSIEDKKKIIIREIKIGNYDFNNETIDFIRKNNIDLEEFLNMEEAVLYSEEKINSIIRNYKMELENIDSNISISKILGHDNLGQRGYLNILFTISQFFDSKGDKYHTRSIDMLNYSSEDILTGLDRSFSYEPIQITESDQDKYTISYNGMHRFTVLKLNYLVELLKGDISREELDKKYTIKVSLTKVNFFRTYCNYLLTNIEKGIKYISNNYSDGYNIKADSVKIVMKDGNELILTDEKLYEFVLTKIDNISAFFLQEIEYYYKKLPSFKMFIDKHFQEIKLKFIDKGEINVKGK